MSVPIRVGSYSFKSITEAKAFIRTNVIAAHDGLPQVPAGPIHDFLEDLLDLHEDASGKIGVGVDHFRVDPASNWKVGVPMRPSNRTLVVVRRDGTAEDWGWTGIIEDPSPATRVKIALRNAVYETNQVMKRTAFAAGPVTCPRTGVSMASPDEAQLRHYSPTFAQLADSFGLTVGGLAGITTMSSGAGAEIADPAIEAAWIAYYAANASPVLESKY